MTKQAMVTERQLTEHVKMLRNKTTRDSALAGLLDNLSDLMMRSGWRAEGARVRRVAEDMHMALSAPDTSGLGHDDVRSLSARVAARYLANADLPQEDRSTHETVVEYAVREMMKRKAPRRAAEITAQKLSGSHNRFLGPVIPLIDPKKLEVALWDRLVEVVLENIRRFKPGAEEMALGAAIDHFRQGKAVEKKVRGLVIKRLGRDPFSKGANR